MFGSWCENVYSLLIFDQERQRKFEMKTIDVLIVMMKDIPVYQGVLMKPPSSFTKIQ